MLLMLSMGPEVQCQSYAHQSLGMSIVLYSKSMVANMGHIPTGEQIIKLRGAIQGILYILETLFTYMSRVREVGVLLA